MIFDRMARPHDQLVYDREAMDIGGGGPGMLRSRALNTAPGFQTGGPGQPARRGFSGAFGLGGNTPPMQGGGFSTGGQLPPMQAPNFGLPPMSTQTGPMQGNPWMTGGPQTSLGRWFNTYRMGAYR